MVICIIVTFSLSRASVHGLVASPSASRLYTLQSAVRSVVLLNHGFNLYVGRSCRRSTVRRLGRIAVAAAIRWTSIVALAVIPGTVSIFTDPPVWGPSL